jgi:N-acetylglucosamine-6-phosphate deacetylase
VIKHRWGETADGIRFEGAACGIKFALGENVKQSNWGDRFTTRYPQTRMGVEQVIRDRFLAARDYTREWEEWRRDRKKLPPPRRDLQLEALAEILAGERIVHCHAYRQDEMLMLIRLAEELGFRVGTFEHGLEGYKIANEMAAHGVGGSSFSDWWAYKFEVYDAIPYNGAIMWDRGVLVSFNSDSAELARRLNTEAAKAVKYGGVPEAEALKFVTLNPAKMLGIDHRVGSLEPGKDGDFTIWNASPLSSLAVAEETWIEGRRFFDRERDLEAREGAEAGRLALLERAQRARVELEARGVSTGWQPTFGTLHGESELDHGIDLEQGMGQLSIHEIELLRQAREED